MTLKYFRYILITFFGLVMLGACLSSDDHDYDRSKDAQIYSFSMSSRVDSNRYLSDTKFSIDQLSGRIFNRDSLPYLFDIDSVKLDISAGRTAGGFSNLEIVLVNEDSVFTLENDSIPFKRLKSIKTTAADGESMLKYEIDINIHQQDPYIISWAQMTEKQVDWTFDSQKTVCHNGAFFTYYKEGDAVRAVTSAANDGAEWTPVVVSGLPANVNLSSLVAVTSDDEVMYILTEDDVVWHSFDGLLWEELTFEYPVKTIYGIMPMLESTNQLLLLVDVEGEMRFATTVDFNELSLWNNSPEGLPVEGFDALKIEKPSVYGANYIVLYGGVDANGDAVDKLWILQEKRGVIMSAAHKPSIDIEHASLFYYDNKIYLLVFDGRRNSLYMSGDYGLVWQSGDDNQVLPEGFRLRKTTSVITDKDNFIWIFGGKSVMDRHIMDVWRGRLNKLAVD